MRLGKKHCRKEEEEAFTEEALIFMQANLRVQYYSMVEKKREKSDGKTIG